MKDSSFSEEKEAKRLYPFGLGAKRIKVLWFFLSRKNILVLSLVLCGCTTSQGIAPRADAKAGLDVAAAALAGGAPGVALDLANHVLAGQPRNEKAMLVQAASLTALGRDAEARASYAHALAIDPHDAAANIGLGRLLLPDDPVRAETLLLEALHNNPRNAVALNDLGVAQDLRGDHTAAQNNYGLALAADSSMHAAEVNLALSMALTGRAPDAVRRLAPLASAPGASRRVRHDYAAALALAGDRAQAATVMAADMPPDEAARAVAAYGASAP
jgi:Flp pilus assembly protein TadD